LTRERQASGDRPDASYLAPCSEAQFKTLKYCPTFPDRFGSLEDARRFGQVFFPWHNDEHHHSGLGVPPGEGRRLG
jgi:putative transposase